MIVKEITEQSETHQNLMLKLYHHHVNPAPKLESALHHFKLKVELEKSGPHHKPYEAMKMQTFIYRLIFIALGALFFFFGVFIYEQSINWLPYSYIFSNALTAKHAVLTFCLLLSFSSFGMSIAVSQEKEALDLYIKRTKRKLNRIYNKQALSVSKEKFKHLKQAHHDVLEKIQEMKEGVKVLLSQIAKFESQKPKKAAKLYNEALLEFNDELHLVINQFKKNTSKI